MSRRAGVEGEGLAVNTLQTGRRESHKGERGLFRGHSAARPACQAFQPACVKVDPDPAEDPLPRGALPEHTGRQRGPPRLMPQPLFERHRGCRLPLRLLLTSFQAFSLGIYLAGLPRKNPIRILGSRRRRRAASVRFTSKLARRVALAQGQV